MTGVRKSVSEMTIKPIGWVQNEITSPMRDGWEAVTSSIVLNADLAEATAGLEEFSHIFVVFWMHEVEPWTEGHLRVHPRGRQDLPLVGLFASRSPRRPNPIGLSAVELLECRGNILKVKGLDAMNGTPVLDVKPYLPRDLVANAGWPAWVAQL